jgi:hypothetical protein
MLVVGTFASLLPKYVSYAFGSLDKPWKPGHLQRLRRHLLPPLQTIPFSVNGVSLLEFRVSNKDAITAGLEEIKSGSAQIVGQRRDVIPPAKRR